MLCVYGVVRSAHPGVEVTGVQSQPTWKVCSGELGAIVSEASDLLARRRDVEAHLDVLEQALDRGDVLPYRFGTVVDDAPALCGVLERSASHYLDLLARIGGRVQMTVKVVRDDDESVRTVVTSDPHLRQQVSLRRGSAAAWTDRVALGERVAAAVDRLSQQDLELITHRLATTADAIEVAPAQPPAIASIALLARPDQLAELDNAVASLHDTLGQRMRFEYAGPMPAYSFVS